ncbi:MAG: chromate efflux transporter [Hyphomicrobium sp.]|jgi:chromate transporter
MSAAPNVKPVDHPSFAEAFRTYSRIGALSFGGPAGQIALMHRILVDEKRWIDEPRFLSALNFCMLLPGPEAMQLATYTGWRLHGVKGGLAAGLLFVLPGALVMLGLALFYAHLGNVPQIEAIFLGVKAAVMAIVVEALLRVARRALKGGFDWLIAAAAFLGIYMLGVPFPVIVMAAAVIGFMRSRGSGAGEAQATGAQVARVAHRDTVVTILIWLAVWVLPLLGVALLFGSGHVLTELALFYSKLAVVTFGGAYAVLAYMAQQVVEGYGWLSPGEMLDALGLAETTPGPLILVTEFVSFLAAFRHGCEPQILMGILGAVVALWATFAPCFLWIFAGAPYIEQLNREPRLKAALAAVTAAVVGVILNLTLWFAVHVLFAKVGLFTAGPIGAAVPEIGSIRVDALALSVLAFLLLFGLHRGVLTTLVVCAVASLGYHMAGGFAP